MEWQYNYKAAVSPKCQICSRSGHTTPYCFYKADNTQNSGGFLVCQIYGKRGHIALECFHRNNFSYQETTPPTSLVVVGMGAQGSNDANGDSNMRGFSNADT